MSITIHLDKDEKNNFLVKNIADYMTLDDLVEKSVKKFKLSESSNNFGLKTKV